MAEVSPSVGRYLCAVRLLSMGTDEPARTGELADRLSVSAASVTEMLSTMEERGLATYEKYQGVELTPEGEAAARELLWKHCLAENLLAGDATDEMEVREFGHALSDDVADRLRAYIDHPCDGTCRAPNAEYAECREDVQREH